MRGERHGECAICWRCGEWLWRTAVADVVRSAVGETEEEGEESESELLGELLGGLALLATEQSVSDVWPESQRTAPILSGGGRGRCLIRPRE